MMSQSQHSKRSRTRPLGLVLAASALLATLLPAVAAQPGIDAAGARARYDQERARCLMGESGQPQATCLREAGAALQAAREGKLDDHAASYQENALQRCKPLPPDDAKDCRDRIMGQGTVSGSVKGGGLYREKVTIEVGKPEQQPPAEEPAPSTMPSPQPRSRPLDLPPPTSPQTPPPPQLR